jgi:hypothetical protein
MSDWVNTCDSSNQSWFTMCHMTDCSDVLGGLTGDNLRRQRCDGFKV